MTFIESGHHPFSILTRFVPARAQCQRGVKGRHSFARPLLLVTHDSELIVRVLVGRRECDRDRKILGRAPQLPLKRKRCAQAEV